MTSDTSGLRRGPEHYKIHPDADGDFLREYLAEATSATQDQLNRHLINSHLVTVNALSVIGFRYDAELALYKDYSLQPTADASVELLHQIHQGNFGKTDTYDRITKRFTPGHFALNDFDPTSLLHAINSQFYYTQRIAAELTTLGRLGLATVDELPKLDLCTCASMVTPITDDSFFKWFHLITVE